MKKVAALNKAIEIESKKVKREIAAGEKEAVSAKVDHTNKFGSMNSTRRQVNSNLLTFWFIFDHNYNVAKIRILINA